MGLALRQSGLINSDLTDVSNTHTNRERNHPSCLRCLTVTPQAAEKDRNILSIATWEDDSLYRNLSDVHPPRDGSKGEWRLEAVCKYETSMHPSSQHASSYRETELVIIHLIGDYHSVR